MGKKLNWVLIYLFPILVVGLHLCTQPEFIRENWIFYVLGFGLLLYIHVAYHNNKNKRMEELVRKIYFLYTYFFLIFIFPDINQKYNIWEENGGIFELNQTVSTGIVIFIISFILYITVISDFHISEISFGNTKISMMKEKYDEEMNSHFKNTNQLLEKIEVEGQIIYNMKEYCQKVKERIDRDGIFITKEYQILLTEYFNQQKDEIAVSVFQELDESELKEEFGFKNREINIMKYRLGHGELYSTKLNNVYYLFIPFCYIFEKLLDEKEKPIYIILESKIPISVRAESNIIRNILIKFVDDLLELL